MHNFPFWTTLVNVIKSPDSAFADPVDRLNYLFTPTLLAIFACALGAKQNFGSPMQCYVPENWHIAWEKYAEDYCFVTGTYYVSLNETLIRGNFPEVRYIGYYQWVPFMLFAQAILLVIPHLLWESLCQLSGLRISSVLKLAHDASQCRASNDGKEFISTIYSLAIYIEDLLDFQTRKNNSKQRFQSFYRCYICLVYVVYKLVLVMNIVAQFMLTSWFLRMNFFTLGYDIAKDRFSGIGWTESGRFPRLVHCHLKDRVLGNMNDEKFLCVLMLQMLYEKVYIILWVWLILMFLCTLGSLCYWIFFVLFHGTKKNKLRAQFWDSTMLFLAQLEKDRAKRMIAKYLAALQPLDIFLITRPAIRGFCNNMLDMDGMLLFRFIAIAQNDFVAAHLVAALFERYTESLPNNSLVYPKHQLPNVELRNMPSPASSGDAPSTSEPCHSGSLESDDAPDSPPPAGYDNIKMSSTPRRNPQRLAPPTIPTAPELTPSSMFGLRKILPGVYAQRKRKLAISIDTRPPAYGPDGSDNSERIVESSEV